MRNRGSSFSFGALGLWLMAALLAVLVAAPAIAGTVNFGPSGTFSKIGTGRELWTSQLNNLKVYSDPSGPVLFALWQGSPFSNDDVMLSTGWYDGDWWGPSINVAGMEEATYGQALAITSGPVLHVFSSYDETGTSYIRYTRSTDWGGSWSTPVVINPTTPGGRNYLSVASDSAGNLYAFWEGRYGIDYLAYLSYSTDGGETWLQETVASNYRNITSIAVDPSNNVYVTWHDINGNQIFRKGALNAGVFGWLTQEIVVASSVDNMSAGIAAYDANHIYIVNNDITGALQCYYTSDGGSTWGQTMVTSAYSNEHSLAVDANGYVGIAWEEADDIHFARSIDGCKKFRDTGLISDESVFHYPHLAFDPSGKALIMFEDRSWAGGTVISFKKEQ